MTRADDITAIWESVQPVFEDVFYESTYALYAKTSDGNAGWTIEPDEVPIETGRCQFLDSSSMQGDQTGEGVIVSLSPYTVELPLSTVATSRHRIVINGRTFLIDDVKQGGQWDRYKTAALTERKP